jgi:hypothetical protein
VKVLGIWALRYSFGLRHFATADCTVRREWSDDFGSDWQVFDN